MKFFEARRFTEEGKQKVALVDIDDSSLMPGVTTSNL